MELVCYQKRLYNSK